MQPLKNTEEALKSRVAQLERVDPELARELKGVREKKRGKKAFEEMASFLESRAEPGEQPPQPPQQPMALETIVLRTGRPVLAVVDDGIQLQFNDVESEVWRSRLEAVSAMLRDAVRAVGRVEVTGHPHFEWIGTAWLVAPDVVVTNRHVAGEFGRSRGNAFSFRVGATGRRHRVPNQSRRRCRHYRSWRRHATRWWRVAPTARAWYDRRQALGGSRVDVL